MLDDLQINVQMMKKTTYTLLAAATLAAAGSANAALLAGQTIGIDFANGPATPGAGIGTNFNLVQDTNALAAGSVINLAGDTLAGVSVTISGTYQDASRAAGENNVGYGAAAPGSYYDGTFYSDAVLNDGTYRNPGSIVVTISGLDDNLLYDITAITTGLASQNLTATLKSGGLSDTKTYDQQRNVGGGSLTPLSLSGLSSTGGVLSFESENLDGWQVFNGATITAVAVPEPSSTALLGLGGLSLILRRRR